MAGGSKKDLQVTCLQGEAARAECGGTELGVTPIVKTSLTSLHFACVGRAGPWISDATN